MNPDERRLILDRCFDRALDTVLEAFVVEGFTMTKVSAGDLHRCGDGGPLRYALLEATLPELKFGAAATTTLQAVLGCQISLFELAGSCTLVTVQSPVGRYPLLATLVPRLNERVGDVLRSLLRAGTLHAA
jgi:hypothetical protein